MNGHPNGCQCSICLGQNTRPLETPGIYAYAASWPNGPFQPEPSPVVALYMVTTPSQPFPGGGITWPVAPAPESPEVIELRKLREEIAKLAKSQEGMRKLVERFLAKGKRK